MCSLEIGEPFLVFCFELVPDYFDLFVKFKVYWVIEIGIIFLKEDVLHFLL